MKVKAHKMLPFGRVKDPAKDPSDNGEIRLGVKAHQGRVVMNFGKRVTWISLTPEIARALSKSLTQRADDADGKPSRPIIITDPVIPS